MSKIFLPFVILFFLQSFVVIAHEIETMPILNIYVIKNIDNKNPGDKNSSNGIAKTLKDKFLDTGLYRSEMFEFTIDQKEDLKLAIEDGNKSIIITAGDYGINFIESFETNKNIFIIWSGHQIYQNLDKISNKSSIIILPSYLMNNKITEQFKDKEAKIISTPGVANNIDKNIIKVEYDKYPFLESKTRSIVVFVGGNAPDEFGNINKMSHEDAFYMGMAAAKLAKQKKAFVFATNCWRTTKGQFVEFEKGIIRGGLTKNQYKLYDFHLEEKMYYPFLQQISLPGSEVIVSGESSSTVRDVIEQVNKPIYVYMTQSMNNAHEKQIAFEQKEGRINLIHEKFITTNTHKYIYPIPVNEVIVRELIKEFE